MIEKLAGLPGQIRALERRLKDMDASKVKPSMLKEITDTINNLKSLLKEKLEKKEQRKKQKEEASKEVSKEADAGSISTTTMSPSAPQAPGAATSPTSTTMTPDMQQSCPLCGGLQFPDAAAYQQHMQYTHASDIMPTSPGQKEDKLVASVEPVVNKVETDPKLAPGVIVPDSVKRHNDIVDRVEKDPKIAPHIISEKEEGPKFKLDDVVKPVRGAESTGKVMRWDGKPSDLVYVAWDSGPLSERDTFGGYYPHDLELFQEEPVEAAMPMEKPVCAECTSMKEKHGDLKGNYEALLKDLKEERDAHYTQGNHSWTARLDQKILDLEKAISEKFDEEKTAGAQNNSEGLVVLDHTPARANTSRDEGGKDENHSEFQDQWGEPSRDTESSKNPITQITKLSIFKKEFTATPIKDQKKFGGYDISDSEGKKILNIKSKDSQPMTKDQLEFCAEIELTRGLKQAKLKDKVGFLNAGTNVYILATDKSGKRTKIASPEQGLRGWIPTSKLQVKAIESQSVQFNGQSCKVLGQTSTQTLIDSPTEGPMWVNSTELLDANRPLSTPESLNDIESAQECEYCAGYGKARTKGGVLETCPYCKGKGTKQEKQSAKECPSCDIGTMVEENGHWHCPECAYILPVKKQSAQNYKPGTKARISGGSGIDSDKIVTIVDRSLVKTDGRGIPTNVAGAYKPVDWNREVAFQYEDGSIGTMFKNRLMSVEQNLESAKECSDCHGTFEGKEGETCPTCGRFAVQQKEALKPALPPQILNRRNEVNASGCDQCAATMINGVFCHETGCPNQKRKNRFEDEDMNVDSSLHKSATDWEEGFTYVKNCKSCGDRHLVNENGFCIKCSKATKNSSLKIQAHIRHEDGKWVVYSHDYKKKLGTYNSEKEAKHRLQQIEMFKHMKGASLRPFSKKAEVLSNPYQSLTDHITDMKSRMNQVQDRLQTAPVVKAAVEDTAPEMDLPGLFADLTQGIELLETKLGGDEIEPEIHMGVEELENKLWELEEKLGLTPELSEHEKSEPEHKEIVDDIEDKKKVNKSAVDVQVTDETLEEGTGTPPSTTTPATTTPVIQNVQPTDDDNLNVPVAMPSSPTPPGTKWVFDTQFNKYVIMPDGSNPGKTI